MGPSDEEMAEAYVALCEALNSYLVAGRDLPRDIVLEGVSEVCRITLEPYYGNFIRVIRELGDVAGEVSGPMVRMKIRTPEGGVMEIVYDMLLEKTIILR